MCDRKIMDVTLKCSVCNKSDFELRDGYFYCTECGTKQEQLRDFAVEHDNDFDNQRHATKKKILKAKSEKPQITSWECYNYILRGMVDRLLCLGAKEELKLVALQIWAANLRHLEVAFFNKISVDLPRLGPRFLDNDVQVIYNQQKQKRKRKSRAETFSVTSIGSSKTWRRSKKKLDESNYSIHSATTSANTSSSFASGNSITPQFSSRARKLLKHDMPPSKLEKKLRNSQQFFQEIKSKKAADLNTCDSEMNAMNMKKMYSIIAIALNLVNDSIQLCDVVRLIGEGRLITYDVLQLFPENLVESATKLLTQIGFNYNPEYFSYQGLRSHINIMLRSLHIHRLLMPNMRELTVRYVRELNLPHQIACYIGRLLSLIPPEMRCDISFTYPAYEARAMGYVVFVLKLLFGLEGEKEFKISQAAKQVNAALQGGGIDRPKLFVWSDWVRYIEMRKIILSQQNVANARQFEERPTPEQCYGVCNQAYRTENANVNTKENRKVTGLLHILETAQMQLGGNTDRKDDIHLNYSATPNRSYCDQLIANDQFRASTNVPDFMYLDHAQLDVEPFLDLQGCGLREALWQQRIHLQVARLSCEKRQNIGLIIPPSGKARTSKRQKADFNVERREWLRNVQANISCDDFYTEDLPREGESGECGVLVEHPLKWFLLSSNQLWNNPDDLVAVPNTVERATVLDDKTQDEVVGYDSEKCSDTVQLVVSALDYWVLFSFLSKCHSKHLKSLGKQLPSSFLWLLRTCAQTLHLDWAIVYKELIIIEAMFFYGIESLDRFNECCYINLNTPIKEINILLRQY